MPFTDSLVCRQTECYFLQETCGSRTSNAKEVLCRHPFQCGISPTSYGERVCWLSPSNRYL